MKSQSINIRPGVRVLSVLSHLNYQPWYAIAEFVDNALQSFLTNSDRLAQLYETPRLCVSIMQTDDDGGTLIIKDNACGIADSEYQRAFRPAEIPTDRTGLSEFGMGMKSAACWFSPHWSVTTSALGEPMVKTVTFDVKKIVDRNIETLDVVTEDAEPSVHFTTIRLTQLYKPPRTSTLTKIKSHLASIYRVFIANGVLELYYNDELLNYHRPNHLVALPEYSGASSREAIEWYKEINFDFGRGLTVKGFAALRDPASTSLAGFALFRRNRLIQGSEDQGYRPPFIFGSPNTYVYQRLFGELHLEGFEVSHTKDGFQWDDQEEPFLELLKEALDSEPVPLLKQANAYRALASRKNIEATLAASTQRTADALATHAPAIVHEQHQSIIDEAAVTTQAHELSVNPLAEETRVVKLSEEQTWRVHLRLSNDSQIDRWVEYALNDDPKVRTHRDVTIHLNMLHPFMIRFAGANAESVEGLFRVAIALVLAEVSAREGLVGLKYAGVIRCRIDELLREAFSHQ